jgi:hypothetical protein
MNLDGHGAFTRLTLRRNDHVMRALHYAAVNRPRETMETQLQLCNPAQAMNRIAFIINGT